MTERNTAPADRYELLKRVYACNWSQLAERLDVSPRTLRHWRDHGPGEAGETRTRRALEVALRQSGLDWSGFKIHPDQ